MNTRLAGRKTPPQLAARPLERRDEGAEREPMSFRVSYSYEAGGSRYFTEGVTRDFSKSGCAIRGTVIPPMGTKILVALHFGQNLRVTTIATITWVSGEFFGVRFHQVKKNDYIRIRQYMRNAINRSVA